METVKNGVNNGIVDAKDTGCSVTDITSANGSVSSTNASDPAPNGSTDIVTVPTNAVISATAQVNAMNTAPAQSGATGGTIAPDSGVTDSDGDAIFTNGAKSPVIGTDLVLFRPAEKKKVHYRLVIT